jgi:hypothetical protein
MLTAITILKALIEIAGLSLLGQGILYALAGPGRDSNLFYRALRTITRPVVRATRLITPRLVHDSHLGYVAFFLLAGLWVGMLVEKSFLCMEQLGHGQCTALLEKIQANCGEGNTAACELLREQGQPLALPATPP